MADKKKKTKKTQSNDLRKFVSQRKSYLTGVALGLILILVNTIIGLYVVVLMSENQGNSDIEVQTLPVPEIDQEDYISFRDDFLRRQKKELQNTSDQDPFKTSEDMEIVN